MQIIIIRRIAQMDRMEITAVLAFKEDTCG